MNFCRKSHFSTPIQQFNIILLLADEHVLATYIKISEKSRFRRSRKAEIHSKILIIIIAIHAKNAHFIQ